MNRLFRFFTLVALAITFSFQHAQAGNIVAADLTYKHISGLTYELNLTVFFECGADVKVNEGYQVDFQSLTCNVQDKFNMILQSKKIVSACGNTLTRCEGGTGLGFYKAIYSKQITLPKKCNDWVFSWQDCNRSKEVNTIVSPQTKCLYLESTLNNLDFEANDSPTFPNDPVAFLTLGSAASINPGTIEKNGDKLEYSLIAPRDKQTTNLVYNSPYSFTNPVSSSPAFALNTANGEVTLTPTKANERTVFAVLVKEIRNGKVVGSVVRDLQIAVQDGKNAPPILSGLSNSSRTDTTVSTGKNFCIKVYGSDPDALQRLTITSNDGIVGGLFSSTGGTKPVGTFCWTPKDADEGVKTITFTVKDDACPQLVATKEIKITVKKGGAGNCNLFASFFSDTLCVGKKTTFADFSFPQANITTWKWDFGNGTTSDKAKPDVKEYYTKTGKYTVKLKVIDKNKCVDSIQKVITVCEPPTARFGVQGLDRINDTVKIKAICENQIFDLVDSSISNCKIGNREWYVNDKLIGSSPTNIFKYKNPKSGTLKFTLKVSTETSNCVATVSKNVEILSGPKLKTFNSYDFKCTKLDTVVTVTASGGKPRNSTNPDYAYKYLWQKTSEEVTIEESDTLKTVRITYPGDKTTNIKVYAIDANKCGADTTLEIRNPIEISFGSSLYCNPKDTIRFNTTTTSSNDKKPKSVWGIKSVMLDYGDGNKDSSLVTKHLYAKDSVYKTSVIVTDSADCIRRAEATVFNKLPDMTFGLSKDTICFYNSSVNYFGPKYIGESAPIKYTWLVGNTKIDSLNAGGSYIPTFTGKNDVTLKFTYNGGCIKNFSAPLYVYPLAVANIDSVVGKCVPFPVSFYASQKGGDNKITSLDWQFYFREKSGLLTLKETSNIFTPVKTFLDHGNHFARITTIDSKGCRNIQPDFLFRVEKMAKPCFTISGFCASEKLAFTKDCTLDEYDNITSVKWDFGDGKQEFVFNPFHSYPKAGKYTVKCTLYNELDNKGCNASADSVVTIFPQPVAKFTHDTACFQLPNRFLGDSIPSDEPGDFVKRFVWLFDNKLGTLDSAFTRNTVYQFKNFTQDNIAVTASMIAVNKFNCGDTLTKPILVYPKPNANFSYDYVDQEITPNKPMFFEGKFNASNPNTSSSDVVQWLYDFGDGGKVDSKIGNEQHTYSTVAKYDVQLIAINNNGCSDTIFKKLDLNAYMVVPNTVTPEHNFEIVARGISKINGYKIYNRWGQVVFDGKNDIKAQWDGTFNGEEQPMGVYVYFISATTIYGEELPRTGNLTLVR